MVDGGSVVGIIKYESRMCTSTYCEHVIQISIDMKVCLLHSLNKVVYIGMDQIKL